MTNFAWGIQTLSQAWTIYHRNSISAASGSKFTKPIQ